MSKKALLKEAKLILNLFAKHYKQPEPFLSPIIQAGMIAIRDAAVSEAALDKEDTLVYKVNRLVVSTLYLYYLYSNEDTALQQRWPQLYSKQAAGVSAEEIPSSPTTDSYDSNISRESSNIGTRENDYSNQIEVLSTLFKDVNLQGKHRSLSEDMIDLGLDSKFSGWCYDKSGMFAGNVARYIACVRDYNELKVLFDNALNYKASVCSDVSGNRYKDAFFRGLQQLREQILDGYACHHYAYYWKKCHDIASAMPVLAEKVQKGTVSEADIKTFQAVTRPYSTGTRLNGILSAIVGAMLGFVIGVVVGTVVAGPTGTIIGAVGGAAVGGVIGRQCGFFVCQQPFRAPLVNIENAATRLLSPVGA